MKADDVTMGDLPGHHQHHLHSHNKRFDLRLLYSRFDPDTKQRNHLFDHLHMTFSFFLVYTAFSAIQNLESTINHQEGLGSASLAVLYLVLCAACFLAPLIVSWLGSKYSIVLAFVFQCLFVAANIKPTWYTLIPASALLGFGAAFLWAAEGSYLTWCALSYARMRGETDEKSTQGLFNGIFFGIFQMTQIIGNLLSSLVLGSSVGPSESTQTTLFVVFLCTAAAGTALSALLRPQTTTTNDDTNSTGRLLDEEHSSSINSSGSSRPNVKEQLLSTVKLMRKPKMFMLLPIFYYCGLEQAFAWGDFTSNVIAPSVGKQNIGFVMATFGAADVLGSLISGRVSDRIGRLPIISIAALMQFSIAITLAMYTPPSNAFGPLIAMAVVWGFADGIWNTLLNAMLGAMFTKHTAPAFSNLKLFQSAAVSAAFFYGPHVEFGTKLSIVSGSLVFGMICLFVASLLNRPKHKRDSPSTD
eukprot:TRINITY_DN1236_c0_g1_i1.p1 TRINITY_DN1236_c0_g1~~TRINITY_DN1236_c0_g1_i1.p1  ORF type:complete len:472 (+),score=74.47 TRINITY_DN1236_c0_g1_i1:70-1485(+)